MKQPFFSIIIPTYNRVKLLKAAIEIALSQRFKDFEIIVVDDKSTDDTRNMIQKINDKRIKYYRNEENLGAEKNMIKSFSYPRGKYIFTIGDDDFILFPDTLLNIKKIIEKQNLGFIRLNLIEKKFIGNGLRKSIINTEKDIYIKPNRDSEAILNFFGKVAVGHYAGLVIKNYKNISDDMINCRETEWIKIIFKNTKKYGALFLSKEYMIITWSQAGILTHYDVPNTNKLMFENYTDYIFTLIPENFLSVYKHNFYKKFVLLQPVIKLYSGNNNLRKFNNRLFELDNSLKNNLLLKLFYIIAIVFPKKFWNFIRIIQHKSKNYLNNLENLNEIYERYTYLNNKYNFT